MYNHYGSIFVQPSVSVVFCFLSHAKTYISISLCRFLFPVPCQNLHFHQSLSFSVSCPMSKPTFPCLCRFLFPVSCQNIHFHQSLSFSVSCPMPKPTFPSVSVVFCFLSHAKTYISISLCRFLFPVPCQNLHFHQSLSFSVKFVQ